MRLYHRSAGKCLFPRHAQKIAAPALITVSVPQIATSPPQRSSNEPLKFSGQSVFPALLGRVEDNHETSFGPTGQKISRHALGNGEEFLDIAAGNCIASSEKLEGLSLSRVELAEER